ncbi:hypothetical protein PYV61_12160, partial [Roseisolibacter sp. H3M3-2]
ATPGGDATATAPVVAGAPTPAPATPGAPTLASTTPGTDAATRVRAGHVLGDGFEDLDDGELAAVLDAIEHDGASLPALEPVVFAPEFAGGDG